MVTHKLPADAFSAPPRPGAVPSALTNNLLVVVARFDAHHRHTYVNATAAQVTGRPVGDFIGKTHADLGWPTDLCNVWNTALRAVFSSGESQEIQFTQEGPQGPRSFRSLLAPEHGADGTVSSVIAFARDATVESDARLSGGDDTDTLDMAAEYYKAIVDSSDDAIIGKTLDGIVTSWNRGAQAIFGYSALEMLGHSLLVLFPPDRIDEEPYFISRLVQGERIEHFETVRIHKDGHQVAVSVTISPIRDAYGRVVGASKIARDISEVKRIHAALRHREAQLTRVIDGSDQGYWDWNLQTDALEVSPRWETMLGYTPGEMQVSQGRYADYVHPQDLAKAMALARQHVDGTAPYLDCEIRCRTKAGGWCWIQSRGRIVEWDAQGKPLMMSGTHTDITQRKSFELSQREASTVFESSYEGIMVVNPEGLMTRINPSFTRITGYTAAEAIGQSPKLLASGRQEPGFYREMWASLNTRGVWSGEIWNRRKSGEVFAQLLSISTVRDDTGAIEHYVGVFSDISQIKAHEAELDRVAHFDPLTGAPNRRLLADRMEQSIARANRSEKSLAVCYLDLDGFKAVNDHYGHASGDQLLVGVTQNLRQVLRSEDTLARLGGDEFVLLLSDISSPEECSLILGRVLNCIKTPYPIEGAELSVSASIGVSLYPQDHADADTLLRHADQAMYRAKEAGKNRFHLFDPDSDRKAQIHRQFVERLHEALRRDEFVLYYQPKVDLQTGRVIGAEALIRWQHPEQGLLSPAAFLSHVEGSSVDHPLGVWVIDTALKQAAYWMSQGHPIKVSVNIGAHHLLRHDFLQDLEAALARRPSVPAQWLELEVLESAAISDMDQAVAVLHRCHALGVSLALDDFGTGYSSLTYLRRLPIDVLKIDQSFVRDMLTDAEDFGIVECVIRLAAAFHRQVIAEGVETLAHGAALLRLGCTCVQGYGIARPMQAAAFLDWCQQWEQGQAWLGKL